MRTFAETLNKKAFPLYYFLTFLLLALIPILAVLFNNGSLDFEQATLRAAERTGLELTSNLLIVFRFVIAEPVLLLIVLGSAVPALAAIITISFLDRKNKWRVFWGRLKPLHKKSWTADLFTYAEIIVILLLGLLLTYVLRQYTGGDYQWPSNFLSFDLLPAILVMAFLDQGAILEELGWRGFANPELQNKGMNPLKVAILIGICWGLWHVPRDVTTGVIDRLGTLPYLFLFLPSFLLGTVAVSIIASFYMNKLHGSVIPAIVIHGITNDALGISGQASIIEALTPYHQFTRAIIFIIIAGILVKYSGTMLNFKMEDGSQ